MASTILLEIVTPRGKTFSGDVEMVTIPGIDGELGIVPQHAPLLTQLKPGVLRIRAKGEREDSYLAVGEGFVEVLQDRVSVLTDMAVSEAEVDEAAVEAAMAKAEKAKRERGLGSAEVATVESMIAKSLAQLHLKRRRRSH